MRELPESSAARLERWLVRLVALHSLAVGVLLVAAPAWATRFGGWPDVSPLFFVRQAGVFHLIVGVAYLAEHRRCGTVRLLLFAKTVAVLFLTALWLFGEDAWGVPLAAAGDAAMGAAVALAHRARTTGSPPRGAAAPSSS